MKFMKQRSFFSKVLSGSLLISGTTIGAGMLGIPAATAQAGFRPGLGVTTLVWLFMMLTGMMLLEATFWMKERASFLSIAEKFLGSVGKALTFALFIFLYISLMVAYFAAGVPLFTDFLTLLGLAPLSGFLPYLLFGLTFGAIVGIGPRSIDRVNVILTLAMCGVWILLMVIGWQYVESAKLKTQSILGMWWATPILFGAFGYHNIIPSLSTYFHQDKKALRASLWIGTSIPFIIYSLWQFLIIGAVGREAILATSQLGLPITYALKTITQNPYVMRLGQAFAFLAIVTSTLGVAFSLVDFLADGMRKKPEGFFRWALCFLIFGLPMLFSYYNPTIFEQALGLAGGFGEALLNGVMPIAVYYVGRYLMRLNHQVIQFNRMDCALLMAFALVVMGIEVAQIAF